jgi:hypothetical protein
VNDYSHTSPKNASSGAVPLTAEVVDPVLVPNSPPVFSATGLMARRRFSSGDALPVHQTRSEVMTVIGTWMECTTVAPVPPGSASV